MKKLMLLAILMYGISCSNPEDKATGDPDSTSFNQSGNDKNLNTAGSEPGNQSHANEDTSSMPGTSKRNADTTAGGTNRSYKPGGDTTKKQ